MDSLDKAMPDGSGMRKAGMTAPRFMTDAELRQHFGLSERAMTRLRATKHFPRKDPLIGKTDRKVVERFFDHRAGLTGPAPIPDGDEHF